MMMMILMMIVIAIVIVMVMVRAEGRSAGGVDLTFRLASDDTV